MAQVNGGSVIERHLEKIVLGVCALALLYGLFRWGFGSPRKLESENLPLRRIDEELLAKAAAAEAAAKKATIVTKPLPDYDQAIQTLQSADFGSSSSRMVDLGFAREALKIHVGPLVTRVKPSVAELSKLPAPGGPEGRARMELPNTAGELKDARAYHAALVYPWASVARLWQEKLAQTIIPSMPVVIDVEVQVQEKLPDGDWGAPRSIRTAAMSSEANETRLLDQLRQQIRSFDGGNALRVREAIRTLQSPAWQQWILMPPYWQIRDPKAKTWADWTLGLPAGPFEQVKPRAPAPKESGEGGVRPSPPAGERPAATDTGRDRRYDETTGRFVRPVGEEWAIEEGRWDERRTDEVQRPTTVEPAELPAAMAGVPPLTQQQQDGRVLVWFHDANLAPMKIYRYQVRLVFLNPLLTYDQQCKDPEDAKVATIETPWSDWSQEVSVPKSTVFFITGESPNSGEVVVTVFTRCLGEPVKEEFYVKIGRPIGEKVLKQVTHPVSNELVREETDFTTGAIAVDFDFDKKIVSDDLPHTTVEMLYLDERGRLRTRTRAADEEDEDYRTWRDATRAPVFKPASGTERSVPAGGP